MLFLIHIYLQYVTKLSLSKKMARRRTDGKPLSAPMTILFNNVYMHSVASIR